MRKSILALGIASLTLLGVVFGSKLDTEKMGKSLSEEQINSYRTECRYINNANNTLDYVELKEDEFKENIESFVRVKVLEKQESYSTNANIKLDDGTDIKFEIEFDQYLVKVEDVLVSNSSVKKGDIITISIRKNDESAYIDLKENAEVIVPIEKMSNEHGGNYIICYDVSFYVVDNDYLISAYDNDFGYDGYAYNQFKEEIK